VTSTAPPAADLGAGGPAAFTSYQKGVAALLAFLQFTLVLDFMVLSPLGAFLMPALRITPSQFGLVVSTYAFSAGASGILTAGFADRFDRKKLLLWFYAGFLAGTLLCGIASSYHFLLFGRLITGLFAGLVGSVSFAIVTDVFPLHLRGRVMGVIQTAFAASSVLGIPLSLLLATHFGWNAPFFLIVAVAAAVGLVIRAYLRPVTAHLTPHAEHNALLHLLHTISNRRYLYGFASTALLTMGGFMLMPFMSVFAVHNVGIAIDKLPIAYVVVGAVAAIAGPLIGRASDAYGSFKVFACGSLVTVIMVVIYTHLTLSPLWVLIAVLTVLQVGIFSRIISSSALMSALPAPADRGSYMSISSSLQQLAGGIAAIVSGLIVVELPGGALLHFDTLGYVLVGSTLVSLVLLHVINRHLHDPRRTVGTPTPALGSTSASALLPPAAPATEPATATVSE
jgi:predicted MFS family arabinose efflux permease